MKAKVFLLLVIVAALAAVAGWYVGQRSHRDSHDTLAANEAPGGRKILYYQSAMHPWIKSDRPGNCTICGMKLSPVYEGEKGVETPSGVTVLSSNIVNVINVQTSEVRTQALTHTLHVAGTIDDSETRHRILSAYIDGRIDELHVTFVGAEVTAGEPLASLYSPMLLAAEREFLSLTQPSGSLITLQDERQRLAQAAAQRLSQLGLTEKQIEGLSSKAATNIHTEILAPMTGTVVTRNVYEGQYVKEGDKLYEIADFSTMWFVFDIYERDLAWLQPGQIVEITVPAVPGRLFSAPIAFIDPNIKDPTRSAKGRVELENPIVETATGQRRLLYHKLYADGLVKAELPQVLTLPRSAVLSPGGDAVVYVEVSPGSYEQRRVKLGRAGTDLWEVLSGVAAGEKVVTTGNLLIDAQAQLNQSARGTEAPMATNNSASQTGLAPTNSPPALTKLAPEQTEVVTNFLRVAAEMSRALASDNLAQFNEHAAALQRVSPLLTPAFSESKDWQPYLEKLVSSGRMAAAPDLAAARKSFLPFTQATVEFGLALRRQDPFRDIKIFQCPMVNDAIPGAPRKVPWMQLQGPLRNPFFGAEMLECGTEIKP